MEHDRTKDRNYWQLLAAARDALQAGDFATAERRYLAASTRRDKSPGRVFLTESLTDGLGRLLRGRRRAVVAAGRWEQRAGAFRADFLEAGEGVVREGLRLAELRPEDDAEANQPVIEAALFLVVRSRIFPEEPASAVPLLKGLFRTAARCATVFDVQLIRHDVPLTEEDRLWLARRGSDLLEVFVEQGRLVPGSGPAREWAAAILHLLQPRYFGSTGRLGEERAWLEAVSADRLQGDAAASVRLYRAFLEHSAGPGPRADEARVRILELLANSDRTHFHTPRYTEALGALQSAGLAPGSEQTGRYRTAVARIEYRRPEADAGRGPLGWATAALGSDGAVTTVFWWGSEPRDVARWSPGEDPGALAEFLEPCADRILARDTATITAIGAAGEVVCAPWPVGAFVEALAEPELPDGGVDRQTLVRLATPELGPWRSGWRSELGHPDLAPPDDAEADLGPGAGLGGAVTTGLVVLALRTRVARADPSLRAGLGELARRGDAASSLIYGLLTLGDEAARAMDASFAAWTLPLLWTRPDPFADGTGLRETLAAKARPDLGRNDVAIVTTGDPAGILAAWGADRSRWRVVLDRVERLADIAPAAAHVIGPVTVIPRDGRVHRLDRALGLLEELAARRGRGTDPADGLLALFHWVRLVTSHNGDLNDFRTVRPRRDGSCVLHDRYAEILADLEQEEPHQSDGGGADGWAAQFSQRVRKAGFVAGHASQMTADPERLDALWGVFEGSDASWVFLDAAVVHAQLAARGAAAAPGLHALLVQRGTRHLSLLTGAVWCREDLEDLLAEWLRVYGPAYRLALTDLRCPALLLADRGVAPGGRQLVAEGLAAALAHAAAGAAEGAPRAVLVPASEPAAAFWRAARDRRFALPADGWRLLAPGGEAGPAAAGAVLVVPELAAMSPPPKPAADTAAAWKDADVARSRWAESARRACSLEIAGHLAGAWEAVEIADVRWWRLLRDMETGGAGPWDGGRAAALATAGRARCFDLPETSGEARRRLAPGLVAEVAAWLGGRGGSGTSAADTAAAWPAPGRRLAAGDGAGLRQPLLAAAGAAWERGRLDSWILLVSGEAWPGAAEVVASAGVGGGSVWPVEHASPAPVLWARPADLASGALPAYLRRHRPRAVIVADFGTWLPGPRGDAQAEATALRTLLGLELPTIVLLAEGLPPAWRDYLAEATDIAVPDDPGEVAGDEVAGQGGGGTALPAAVVSRMRRLLARLRPLLRERNEAGGRTDHHPDLDGELVPTSRLAALSGLDEAQVRGAVAVLRWAARLAGDRLSRAGAADGKPGTGTERTHALLIGRRFADLEAEMDRLDDAVALFLPLWLGRLPAGGRTWIDLAQPPAQSEQGLLVHLDAFLLSGGADDTGLDYRAPRGVLNSSRRLAGAARPEPEVRAAVRENLRRFRDRVKEVLAGAVETGDGFLVQTGLVGLRPEEQGFLTLGVALDFWRWFGPAGPAALHLVDLLTLADSPTVRSGSAGWTLAGRVCGARPSAAGVGVAAAVAESTQQRPAGRLRGLLGQAVRTRETDPAVAAVARLAGLDREPSFLVLRGVAGSGRTDAVVEGLALAARGADDPGDVTVYCPDAGVAAVCCRRALAVGLAFDVRLPDDDGLPLPAGAEALGAAGADDVVVMPGIERFSPEQRYRVAQHGRGRRLMMTVDLAATTESWENLFLTTPRADDVVDLDEQREQSRLIWEQVRLLAAGGAGVPSRARRRDKGQIVAEYANNLDHGVARIVAACHEGWLPRLLRLVAPLPADLAYVAGALRDQGWLVVPEEDVDRLLLPGPRELLAAATDLLGSAGALREREAPATAAPPGDQAGLLAALPRPDGGSCPWPPATAPDPAVLTLGDLARWLLVDAAAAPALAHAAARHRLDDLVARWGACTLSELPGEPLWQAWRSIMLADLGRPPADPDRPLVLLATVERPPAAMVPGGVYLCLGSEPPRQHYRVLSRIADTALILYQDRSPLAGA